MTFNISVGTSEKNTLLSSSSSSSSSNNNNNNNNNIVDFPYNWLGWRSLCRKMYFFTNRETLLLVSAVICSFLQGPSLYTVTALVHSFGKFKWYNKRYRCTTGVKLYSVVHVTVMSKLLYFIIIIIIIIIRYECLLSQAFSSWYFFWISGDPHRSGFKLHTAVLSVLCVMFQV